MTALKLNKSARYGLTPFGEKAFRALAIDNARMKVEIAEVADLTDNTTGTAGASVADIPVQTAKFDATSAGGAQRAAFNTALGKIENAGRVLTNSMNNVRARLGMTLLSAASGAQAAKDTIPAQDKTVTEATGTSAADFTTGKAAMLAAKDNVGRLLRSLNEIMIAIGEDELASSLAGDVASDDDLVALTAASASSDGSSSVSKAAADAFLTAVANALASIAGRWNDRMFQTGLSDLTDNTTGTAANGLVANAIPALAVPAATTSSPKAGFDTQLGVIKNNIADLALRVNTLRKRYGLSVLTDNSGGTADTTLAALSADLTAVDGSSGTTAVDGASARDRMTKINNALSSLGASINELCDKFGVQRLTDALGGVVSTTIAAIAATATGVGGGSDPITLLDADVDAWLDTNADNIATLAAKINECTGSGAPTKPLGVVAA
jgi:hypothetical protein